MYINTFLIVNIGILELSSKPNFNNNLIKNRLNRYYRFPEKNKSQVTVKLYNNIVSFKIHLLIDKTICIPTLKSSSACPTAHHRTPLFDLHQFSEDKNMAVWKKWWRSQFLLNKINWIIKTLVICVYYMSNNLTKRWKALILFILKNIQLP